MKNNTISVINSEEEEEENYETKLAIANVKLSGKKLLPALKRKNHRCVKTIIHLFTKLRECKAYSEHPELLQIINELLTEMYVIFVSKL